jgi:hypothetical protein
LTPASETVEIIPPEPSEQERIRMDVEMKNMIKLLSERKRRTFLRYMNGKKTKKVQEDGEEEIEVQQKPRPTKDELMSKLQQLNVGKDGDDDDSEDEEGSDDDFYDYLSSSQEED